MRFHSQNFERPFIAEVVGHNNCHSFVDLADVDHSLDNSDLARMEVELALAEEDMHLAVAVDSDEAVEDIDLFEIN